MRQTHVHATGKSFHNYWTMSDLPVAELKKYACMTGWLGNHCVAACVIRHVPPPRRQGPEHAFTEVLLLAVDRPHERQGYARKLLKAVREASAAAGSPSLLVVSSSLGLKEGRGTYWQSSKHGLGELAPVDGGETRG